MIGTFFNLIFFQPLYNLLVVIVSFLPGHNIGLAIVILTVIIKTVLLPLQHKMTTTQRKIKEIEPEISSIKNSYKNNSSEQAKKIMELYRAHGINPFSGFLSLAIQLPILIALFLVFRDSFTFNQALLYQFVPAPPFVETGFLGVDLAAKSIILSFMVAISQFTQTKLALPPLTKTTDNSFSSMFQKNIHLQSKYVFPVLSLFIAYTLPAAIAIYWIAGNIFSITHEIFVRRLALKTLS
jgi:YidC/Oxa1 family membrane protein insertase